MKRLQKKVYEAELKVQKLRSRYEQSGYLSSTGADFVAAFDDRSRLIKELIKAEETFAETFAEKSHHAE